MEGNSSMQNESSTYTLKVGDVGALRTKLAQMPTGVAEPCNSDMFKSPVRASLLRNVSQML